MEEKTKSKQCDDAKNRRNGCEDRVAVKQCDRPLPEDDSPTVESTQAEGKKAAALEHVRAAKADEKSSRESKQRRTIPNSQTRRMGGGNMGRKSSDTGSETGNSRAADHSRRQPHLGDKAAKERSAESGGRQDLMNGKFGYERNETGKEYDVFHGISYGAERVVEEPGTEPSKAPLSSASDGRNATSSAAMATGESFYTLALPNLERDQHDPQSLVGAWRMVAGAFYRLTPATRRSGPERASYGDESDDEGEEAALDHSRAAFEGDHRQQAVTLADGTLVEDIELVEVKVEQSRRRRIGRLVAMALLAVGIVTVAVAVGVTLSSRRGPDPNPPTSTPTLAPTFAPKPITEAMAEAFRNDSRLSNATLSAMLVDGTPQFKAFRWLTSADHPAIPDDSNPVQRLVQQFALAVLYYATNPTNATGSSSAGGWTNSLGWLEDANECRWFGCNCTQTENETWVLDRLELIQNGLSASALPIEVGLLDSLTTLDLAGNSFLGSIPSELGRLTSLQVLALNNANFTGSIPAQIYQQTDLTKLDLDGNQLTGTVSRQIGQLTKLTELKLWTNEDLTGSLPTELGLLTRISQLTMSSTRFTGPRLSGKLPNELGNLTALTSMTLTGYLFSGTIPTELANLTLLDLLSLYRNNLSGSIPTQLGRLAKLGELDVRDNAGLTGTVPESLCAMIKCNGQLVVRVTCDEVSCPESCGCTCE